MMVDERWNQELFNFSVGNFRCFTASVGNELKTLFLQVTCI